VRDTFRQADPAIPRPALADVFISMQGPAGPAVQTAERMLVAGVDGVGRGYSLHHDQVAAP
jgi:hypothetical protein